MTSASTFFVFYDFLGRKFNDVFLFDYSYVMKHAKVKLFLALSSPIFVNNLYKNCKLIHSVIFQIGVIKVGPLALKIPS